MKVTVSKYLNIRVGEPSVNAPNYQYLAPGSVIEVDGKLYTGDTYDGNSLWYKDGAGNFYWSGGVATTTSPVITDIPKIDFNNSIIKLYPELAGLSGKQVKVGIIDSGIYKNHPSFKNRFKEPLGSKYIKNFSDSADTSDKTGHGTFISGVIGAQNLNRGGINGIAQNCELYIAKIYNDESYSASSISNALNWLQSEKVNIINMSFSTSKPKYNKYKSDLETVTKTGIICTSAAGEDDILYDNSFLYPAMDKNVISVGALSKINSSKTNKDLNFFTYQKLLKSCGNKRGKLINENEGSSISTAILSGIIALILEKYPNANMNKVISIIKDLSKNHSDQNINNPFQIFYQ